MVLTRIGNLGSSQPFNTNEPTRTGRRDSRSANERGNLLFAKTYPSSLLTSGFFCNFC